MSYPRISPLGGSSSQVARAVNFLMGQARQTLVASVKTYGATGDGVTDDVTAIRSAMSELSAAGGGILFFPVGTYLVSNGGSGATCLAPPSNVTIIGAGKGAIIKIADGMDSHAFSYVSVSDFGLYNLTIEGNRDNQSSGGHGIRLQDVDRGTFRDVTVQNVKAYGFTAATGTTTNVTADNVYVDGCGEDAFDLHNDDSLNNGNYYVNCRASNWGLNYDAGDPTTFTKCGFDGRGIVNVVNFRASEPGAPDAVGFRLREGEVGDTHGLGGHKSHIANINVEMNDTANGQKAMVINAREVTVTGANLSGAATGLQVSGPGFKGFGITATGNYDGAVLANSGGFLIPDGVELHGCALTDNGNYGITIPSGVSSFRMFGGSLSGNTTGTVSDAGTDSCFVGVADAKQSAIANDASGAGNQATVNAILTALRGAGLIEP